MMKKIRSERPDLFVVFGRTVRKSVQFLWYHKYRKQQRRALL